MYDITKIFQEIENQLISSMCRNLSRHIDEEQEANVNYSQWQTKQLQALEHYRKENLKEFSKQFEDINNGLKKYLEMTYNNSKTATEHDIISNLDKNSDAIGVNQEKLNALIKSVTDDFQKAEYSLLRRSNDLYRQTIYKAQIGLNTGSITLNQAIDMATKDFLSNGINSIRYKNGNLVNIASYSEMALRTAEKRATMYGDGEKRQEWDIDTVVVYGHNGACPLCSRWQNRVYIDDVYSNGKPNNKYPLLSVAIQGGLYHPNCNCPSPQTYIEGITEPPTQKAPQELEKDIQNYNLEQVQRYNERQIRKYKRLEANSLDDTNKKRYSLKVKEWQSKQRELINNHPETLKRDYSREKIRVLNITEPPKNAIDIDKINLTSAQNSGNIEKRPYEIKKPREKRLEIIKRGIKEEKPIFSYDTVENKFPSYSKNIPKEEGFYDIVTHGADTFVDFFGEPIDAYTLANIIRNRKDYIKSTNIRLISCSTGNTENTGNCFAQILANELGVIVKAPTQIINVYPNGTFFVDDDADYFNPKGEMKLFYPRGDNT